MSSSNPMAGDTRKVEGSAMIVDLRILPSALGQWAGQRLEQI